MEEIQEVLFQRVIGKLKEQLGNLTVLLAEAQVKADLYQQVLEEKEQQSQKDEKNLQEPGVVNEVE